MAANTNLFTDKETNNWFKASIALNVAKQGLTNFLNTELQKVYTVVGRSCGNCPIEKLLLCPTNPYCNKRKRNYCPFHKSHKPQTCPTCDNVKQKIISQHRYGGPSWRNTRAEKWAFDYWEIGKCFLPPDGYSSVSTVQEADFNGVINILLNCLHFQTCLSPSCLSPAPPDKRCPLEKVRQIGRDVRHTADCKVTDADLQDYFQTLSTLLTDPICIQHDPSATTACTRLSDLQNDRMSIEELGELLKEANQTLKNAQETGERFSEEAERTLSKALDAIVLVGEQDLKKKTQVGVQRLKSQTCAGQQSLKSKTKVGEQRIESKTHHGEQRIESKTHRGGQRIESKTQHGEQSIKSKTQHGEQRIESKAQHVEERIESNTQHGEQRIESKTQHGEQCIESKTQLGEQRIKDSVQDGIVRMKHAAKETTQVDYDRGKEDLRRRLMEHYNNNSSNIPRSILDQSLDKRIIDIYETPKIHRIEIAKDGKRVKKEQQVMTYKELFYPEDTKLNRRIYVQGEPGSGKSTFSAKLVNDWSNRNQPSTAVPSENAMFDDVLIIQTFKFIFSSR